MAIVSFVIQEVLFGTFPDVVHSQAACRKQCARDTGVDPFTIAPRSLGGNSLESVRGNFFKC